MAQNGFLIAAPASGSGKTTVSLAIMAALARRGVSVAPFKCGPDFIDPGYHKAVTGKPSINLDAWMCKEEFVLQAFQAGLKTSIAIIEGVMGLFDGFGSSTMEGSSAQIAAITGAPIVLVVNARGMAASAAPLLNGFATFDSAVKIAGVIFNNVGSATHAQLLKDVVKAHSPEITCFGCIPRNESLAISSRHLGLVTADDNPLSSKFINELADVAEQYLDLNGLLALEANSPHSPFVNWGAKNYSTFSKGEISIAVARDAAFCFCYDDNLRLLMEAGAEIVTFSPLNDTILPENISGIYLPGGYPELYAEALSVNVKMKRSVKSAAEAGMPIYAECGGFIYLTEGMVDGADFVGVFPVRTRMLSKRKVLGYREVSLLNNTIIGSAGAVCRGHEFHYSEIEPMPDYFERFYQVSRRGEVVGEEGYVIGNCLGSYIHIHFGSNPNIADSFVTACRRYSSI